MNDSTISDGDDSDFGYDFSVEEETLLLQLGGADRPEDSGAPDTPPRPQAAPGGTRLFNIDATSESSASLKSDDAVTVTQTNHAHASRRPGAVAGPSVQTRIANASQQDQSGTLPSPVSLDEDITYPNLSQALRDLNSKSQAPPRPLANGNEDGLNPDSDGRSPLQRFRSFPKKPLTVSDLTSGMWCELQYYYTLTKLPYGRRTRTPAMRQGSKLHQKLEDEVHTTVKIDILSREDGFGLRLWNLVQGLRTLRDTGLTRELEVWGMVDGNLVNGVIDSLSYKHPNPEFEEELSQQGSQADLGQTSLVDYFPPVDAKTTTPGGKTARKVYLTDVKTRGTLSAIPPALMRPAKIQLFLYHRMLSEMASEKLDWIRVFRRYGLDPDDQFSDAFMCQIGELHDEVFFDTPSSSAEEEDKGQHHHPAAAAAGQRDPPHRDPGADETTTVIFDSTPSSGVPDLLQYGTLRELLKLVKHEIGLTFPLGEASLGHILCVQYLFRDDGREIGVFDFPVSRQLLDPYLTGYMGWWRGERPARGVDVEEAFKCRTCEFAEECGWRAGMEAELGRKAKEKKGKGIKEASIRW